MSGTTVNLMKRTRFEYSFLTASATQTVDIKKAIKVGRFYQVQLLVRVHEKNMQISGQTIRLGLHHTLPSAEDPREISDTTTPPFAYVDVLSSGSVLTAPVLQTMSASNPQAYLKFSVKMTQGTTSGLFYAELSAVAVLREH